MGAASFVRVLYHTGERALQTQRERIRRLDGAGHRCLLFLSLGWERRGPGVSGKDLGAVVLEDEDEEAPQMVAEEVARAVLRERCVQCRRSKSAGKAGDPTSSTRPHAVMAVKSMWIVLLSACAQTRDALSSLV